MKHMKKWIAAFFILYIGFCPVVKAQLSSQLTNRLQVVLDSVCLKYRIHGISVALLVPGAGVWKSAQGWATENLPLSEQHLLGIGSNTKTYTSALLLKLQEQGKVNLNDTIGKWIQNQPNIKGSITIRQLLNHTSGLFNYTTHPNFFQSINQDPSRIWKADEVLQFVDPPYFAPGTNWSYSNTNYLLAGIIIEKVTGLPYHVAMRNEILAPNAMNNTYVYPMDTPSLPVADPWSVDVGFPYQKDILTIPGYSNNAMFSAAFSAGCIVATAEDNVQFWHKLISGQIINASSLAEMWQYVSIGTSFGHPLGYGLGIFRYQNAFSNHTFYEHGGTLPGYIGENLVDSITGVSISALSNQDSTDNDGLLLYVVKALHKVTLQMPVTGIATPDEKVAVNIYPNPAAQFLQVYTTHFGQAHTFTLLDLTGKQQLKVPLTAQQNQINLEVLQPGLYLAQVTNQNSEVICTKKILVQK